MLEANNTELDSFIDEYYNSKETEDEEPELIYEPYETEPAPEVKKKN